MLNPIRVCSFQLLAVLSLARAKPQKSIPAFITNPDPLIGTY